jgi:hypothetical protein
MMDAATLYLMREQGGRHLEAEIGVGGELLGGERGGSSKATHEVCFRSRRGEEGRWREGCQVCRCHSIRGHIRNADDLGEAKVGDEGGTGARGKGEVSGWVEEKFIS